MKNKVRVTQIKSQIGRMSKHKATLSGLGLRRIGHSRVHTLTPQIQGMIRRVNYLIKVEDVK